MTPNNTSRSAFEIWYAAYFKNYKDTGLVQGPALAEQAWQAAEAALLARMPSDDERIKRTLAYELPNFPRTSDDYAAIVHNAFRAGVLWLRDRLVGEEGK